jgi:hypothetical protein
MKLRRWQDSLANSRLLFVELTGRKAEREGGIMAAVDTFEWLVKQIWPRPDDSTRKLIDEKRKDLLAIRNECERLLFVENIIEELRQIKRKKVG